MKTIRSPQSMQKASLGHRLRGESIGIVPTMGALHEGHLSLVERARRENDRVVVSVFVNPAQFGPDEDYLRYPRPFARDRAACRKAGVDYLFVPAPEAMYPPGYRTYTTVEGMSDLLCGAFRPKHFRGVVTVVSKLFNIVQPVRAYFGMKDYQQLQIIRRMTADLNFPVRIVPCPTVREKKGLALSSRNRYLSPEEHERSLALVRSLHHARDMVQCDDIKNSRKIVEKTTSLILGGIPGARIDYVAVCDPETLESRSRAEPPVLVAVAVRVGTTRLIDNILIT